MKRAPLWAVTCLYNPAGYARRAHNYRLFRQHLNVPLLTVELSFDGSFELQPGDADILIQLRTSTVLWHKERLLNIGISRLPAECRYVAWLDCDGIFSSDDWSEAAIRAADQFPLCHLYKTVHHLQPDPPRLDPECSIGSHMGIGYALAQGWTVSPEGVGHNTRIKRGHAWCARRDLLDRVPLYDRAVLGSGDKYIAFGALGRSEEIIDLHRCSPGFAEDYRRWAALFQDAAGRRVGYIDVDLMHLWHGNLRDRRYDARQAILREHAYDPAIDIGLDQQGCWRWNSDKPAMHEQIREYFHSRMEDGHTLEGSATAAPEASPTFVRA